MTGDEIIPFDSSIKIPGTFLTTKAIVSQLLDVLHKGYTEIEWNTFRDEKLDGIAADAHIDGTDRLAFIAWWQGLLDDFPNHSSSTTAFEDLPKELHPLVRAALEDVSALDRHQLIWFGVNGEARQRRSASVATQEQLARQGGKGKEKEAREERSTEDFGNPDNDNDDYDDDDDDDVENRGAVAEGSRGPTVEQILGINQHPLPARPLPVQPSLSDPAIQQLPPRPLSQQSLRHPTPLRRVSRPVAENFFEPLPRAQPPIAPFVPRPLATTQYTSQVNTPPLATLNGPSLESSSFARRVREQTALQTPSALFRTLPSWARAYREANSRRLVDLQIRDNKTQYRQGFLIIASSLPINLPEVQHAALGEYVDLLEIRDYAPQVSTLLDPELAEVYGAKQAEKRKRPANDSMDPLEWEKTFRVYEEVLSWINNEESYEEERRLDVERYREHIIRTLHSLPPNHRHWALEYDIAVRKEVARSDPHAQIRYLGEDEREEGVD